jgi:hypothetical protein
MQLISCSTLFNLTLPSDCKATFEYIHNFASFDFFNPIEGLKIQGFTETDPLNDKFEAIGYGSLYFFDALGSVTAIIALTLLLQLLSPLLQLSARKSKECIKKHNKFIQTLYNYAIQTQILNQNRFTIVNTWLRFLLETYIELTIASVLALYSP